MDFNFTSTIGPSTTTTNETTTISVYLTNTTTGNTNNTSNSTVPFYGKDEIKEYFLREYRNGCQGFYKTQLWSCFEGSIYSFTVAALVLAAIGILGNVIVFLTIIANKRLHLDIFVAIACVILSDTAALVSYFVTGYLTEVIVIFDVHLAVNFIFVICTTMWSCLNAILLTVVRYHLQKEMHSKSISVRIIVANVIFFITGLLLGIAFITPLFFEIDSANYSLTREYQQLVKDFSEIHLYLRLAITSLPFVPGLVLHFMRLRIRNNFYAVRKSLVVVTTIMLTLFNLACLQEVVLISVYLIWGTDLPDWLSQLTTSSEFRIFRINPLPWIINFSIKPLLLIFVTRPVKACMSKICCCFF